ncbi:MAG: hypothetical protein RMM08_08285 [Armatimonadota bacterium]|nr:hypothetical protein [bacterium]MDW8321347.1 hypothetical protein [Armatimonadota bacterium]
MKALFCTLLLFASLGGAWAQTLVTPVRPKAVHPMILSTVKRFVTPAKSHLAPASAQQAPTLTLYDATSQAQLAYDGSYVYLFGPASGEVFREQIPLLGPARLDALQILYSAGGAAGSTVNATVRVYGCRSGFVGDNPITSGFPLLFSFSGSIPADGTYLWTLDLGDAVYNAGNDAQGKPYANDLVVEIVFTGLPANIPDFFIANGANSLGLRNEGGLARQKPSLFPLGAGKFFDDVSNRFHMDMYFTGTSDNVWTQGTGNWWFGGSPLGNFSISVYGNYNFVGKVSNNAGVDMAEVKVQIDGHPVTVPLELVSDNVRAFTLPLTPNAEHDVRIVTGPPYLVRAKSVTASSPATPVVEDFFLISGDLDGDNEVTLFDFGILVQSFGEVGD